MLFSSSVFLFLFLPAILFIYYVLLRRRTARNHFLLFASIFFYGWGEPMFVLVMLLSIAGNWAFGLLIDRYREYCRTAKIVLTAMLLFNFGILFIFKYLVFTLININAFFGANLFVPSIVLPIGISFFTFQAVSYVLDVYRKDTEVQRSILSTGLYIALFPQLIAGPIVRYKTVADQIMNRQENFSDFSAGCCRFIAGFAKKMLLANSFAVVADKAFSMPTAEMSVFFAWLGALAYTFQIYYDFSGYSDMAVGLGKMFGFHFPENFNHPYIALSVSDFWRRWHISLSTWFRDYVYFPMGGSRVKTKSRLVFNLLTVWCLTGVWHGANWTFFLWGFFYFVLLTAEKLTNFDRGSNSDHVKLGKIYRGGGLYRGIGVIRSVLCRCYVILAFVIGWVLFRSETLTQAAGYLQMMFGFADVPVMDLVGWLYFRETFY